MMTYETESPIKAGVDGRPWSSYTVNELAGWIDRYRLAHEQQLRRRDAVLTHDTETKR